METIIKIRKADSGKLRIKREVNGIDVLAFLTLVKKAEEYLNDNDIRLHQEIENYRMIFEDVVDRYGETITYKFKSIKFTSNIRDEVDIIQDCLKFFDTDFESLSFKTRKINVCKRRQFVMALLRILAAKTCQEIGERFKKDHSTVTYAVNTAIPLYIYNNDPEIIYWIEYFSKMYNEPELINKLNNGTGKNNS